MLYITEQARQRCGGVNDKYRRQESGEEGMENHVSDKREIFEGKYKITDSTGHLCLSLCVDGGGGGGTTGKRSESDWTVTIVLQNATYLFGHGSMRTQYVRRLVPLTSSV